MKRTVTYEDLDSVLTEFGFRRQVNDGNAFYVEKATDSVIAVPNIGPGEPLRANHYATARRTIDGRGVAKEEAFERAMRQRGELPASVSPVVTK